MPELFLVNPLESITKLLCDEDDTPLLSEFRWALYTRGSIAQWQYRGKKPWELQVRASYHSIWFFPHHLVAASMLNGIGSVYALLSDPHALYESLKPLHTQVLFANRLRYDVRRVNIVMRSDDRMPEVSTRSEPISPIELELPAEYERISPSTQDVLDILTSRKKKP